VGGNLEGGGPRNKGKQRKGSHDHDGLQGSEDVKNRMSSVDVLRNCGTSLKMTLFSTESERREKDTFPAQKST
jgi:hypothetical protein